MDIAAEKRKQLYELLPEAFSDGRLDVAALKRALGEDAMVESGERYALTWAGKGDAYKVLQTPTIATLQPQRDLSVNFDEAQHLYIEGGKPRSAESAAKGLLWGSEADLYRPALV